MSKSQTLAQIFANHPHQRKSQLLETHTGASVGSLSKGALTNTPSYRYEYKAGLQSIAEFLLY